MNKDIMLGVLIGVILTIILLGISGFFLLPKLVPMFGLQGISQQANNPSAGQNNGNYQPPSAQQQGSQKQGSQSNGTLFGCPELKLVGTQTLRSGVPFTVQNTDSSPHKINISIMEYDFAAGEKKTITVSGWGDYTVPCDGSNYGTLRVGQ